MGGKRATFDRRLRWVWFLVLSGALVIFVFDTREPLGIAGSTLYIGIIFAAYWLRNRRSLALVGSGK